MAGPVNPRAVLLAALPLEAKAITAYLRDRTSELGEDGTTYEVGTFDTGKGVTWDIAVTTIGSGNAAGNQMAAIKADRSIRHFKPDVVMMVGVGGGIKDVGVGDVVVSEKVYDTTSRKVQGQQSMARPNVKDPSLRLLSLAGFHARRDQWRKRIKQRDGRNPAVFIGAIASTSAVIDSTTHPEYKWIRANYSDALAVEMEGHGVLLAAELNQPLQAIVIRGISDLLQKDPAADADSQPIAARHAAAFAFQLLSEFSAGNTHEVQAAKTPGPPVATAKAIQPQQEAFVSSVGLYAPPWKGFGLGQIFPNQNLFSAGVYLEMTFVNPTNQMVRLYEPKLILEFGSGFDIACSRIAKGPLSPNSIDLPPHSIPSENRYVLGFSDELEIPGEYFGRDTSLWFEAKVVGAESDRIRVPVAAELLWELFPGSFEQALQNQASVSA